MASKKLKLHFAKNFLWGASVSAHQVEGGNHNQWSRWELETAQVKVGQAPYNYGHLPVWEEVKAEALSPQNYVSGKAADHFERYPEDFALAKSLNFNVMRSGIEWSRVESKEGVFNQAAILHYRKYFSEMKELGITPVITLWHWTLPDWFAKKGGFAKRGNVKYFTRYVRYISEQLGSQFEYVITINEPTVYAAMSYHEQRWPPEAHSKFMMVWVMMNLAKAHRQSYKIIKKMRPETKIGLAHNCAYYYAGDDSWISKLVAYLGHKFSNEWFINRVKHYQDFFGLNYYFANQVFGTRVHNPDDAKQNDLGWDMEPDKMRPLMKQLYKKYKKPLIVTESGVADRNDAYRKWWIVESVKALNGAITDGTVVKGYIHWSLLDNFEWAEGFWPRFGLIEVDYKTQKRTVRESAKFYGRFIKTVRS